MAALTKEESGNCPHGLITLERQERHSSSIFIGRLLGVQGTMLGAGEDTKTDPTRLPSTSLQSSIGAYSLSLSQRF